MAASVLSCLEAQFLERRDCMATYIKSPLNYIGGKYQLLPQILPKFPQRMNRFFDLFSGGGTSALM